MARKKVKLAWIVKDNARKASLKKRRLGLVKKVSELSILCDVRACLIVFSPDEAEPLVWPSPGVARGLTDRFFALPDIERNKKSMNLESYLRTRIKKMQDKLDKIQKTNQEAGMDQLMYSLHHGRRLAELHLNEMNKLIWYCKGKIDLLQNQLEFLGVQGSSKSADPNLEMELMRSHGNFHGLFGLAFQPPHHGNIAMNLSRGNLMNMGGEIDMGLGLQCQGGGTGHQVMPLLGRDLWLIPHERGEASSTMDTDLRLQPFGSRPHGHEGSMGAPLDDINKTWPNNKDV